MNSIVYTIAAWLLFIINKRILKLILGRQDGLIHGILWNWILWKPKRSLPRADQWYPTAPIRNVSQKTNALAALLLKKGRPGIVFTYKLFTHLALRFFWRRSVAGVLYVWFGLTCDALIGQLAGDADAPWRQLKRSIKRFHRGGLLTFAADFVVA